MISAKLWDDTTYNNKYYSHVGGLSLTELNSLEHKLLKLLNYNLNVLPDAFESYRIAIDSQLVLSQPRDEESSDHSSTTVPTAEAAAKEAFAAACGNDPLMVVLASSPSSLEAGGNARRLAKKLRRSRSFQPSSDNRLFNWRKRRSTSFNIEIQLVVV